MTTDTVCGRFAGEPKHRQWLDALLLTLGSCKSRQRNCHEEEGGEAKGMTGSKLLRRPLAGSVLRNEAYCLAWRDFLHRRLMTNTALPGPCGGLFLLLLEADFFPWFFLLLYKLFQIVEHQLYFLILPSYLLFQFFHL
jgi:hypothetical protein